MLLLKFYYVFIYIKKNNIRLEGKHNVIKGVDRNPKNESKTKSNYLKMFAYLK